MVSVDDEAPIRYVVIGEDNDSELDSHQLDGDNDNLNPSFTLEYFQDANYNSSQIPDSSSYDNVITNSSVGNWLSECDLTESGIESVNDPSTSSSGPINTYVRCNKCDNLISAVDFSNHSKSCKLEKEFKCMICNEQFNREHNLRVHNLKMHTDAQVNENGKFVCILCSKAYSRSAAFYGHLNIHMINDAISCSVCNHEFEYQPLLSYHIRTQHALSQADNLPTVHICSQCSVIVADKEALDEHMQFHRKINKSLKHAKRNKTSDLIEKPHKCHVCCKSFGKKFELSRHLVVHTKERRFNCEKCGKKFSQRSSLSQHVQMHNEEEALRHKCTLCGASFSQAGNLRRHVTLLHPTDVASRTVFRCPHCTCVFNSVQPLQVHMRKRHQYDSSASQSLVVENLKQQEAVTSESQQNIRNRRRLVCCSICGKAFGKCSDLLRHYRVHSGNRPFSCNRCHKNFAWKSSLKLHSEKHIREENAYNYNECSRCHLCMKQLSSTTSLRRHIKLHARSSERCATCSQSFATKETLEKHMSSCTMKPSSNCEGVMIPSITNQQASFQCRICSALFTTLRSLKEHTNRHTGFKPHVCRLCHKSFFSLALLKSHSSVHSNNFTQFKCIICDRSFGTRAQVNDHMREMHTEVCETLCVPQENSEVSEMNEIENEAQQLISDGNDLAVQLFGDADLQTTDVMQKGHHQSQLGNECVFDEFGMIANAYPSLVEQPSSSAVINEPRCPVCLFTFHSETALCSHLANMNIDPAHEFAVLICSICEKSFTGSTQLSEHLRTVHMKLEHVQAAETVKPPAVNVTAVSDEKKHKCGVCGRAFKKPSDLQRHTRIHTGEKPFVCGVCDRAFRVKSTLYQHMKVHDDQNDSIFEVCAVCGKCYCSKSALKQHLLFAHAQHRPFKCTVDTCDQHFQSVRHRDAHVQRFHGNESTNIDNAACIAHKTDASSDLVYDSRDQFIQTAQQLAPSSKNLTTIEPSFTSAFSRPINQNEWNASTNIAIRLSPHTRSGNVLVHINVVSGIPPEDGSVVIELSMLKPLSSEGISLKIPISLPFLTSGSFMAVDAHRILMMLSKTESGTLMVPMNVSTEVTNFPVAVFGALMTTEVAFERAAFTTSCHVCSQYFMSAEESEAHFAGEDHETAELLSFTELNTNPVGNTTLNALTNQYLPSITTKHMANEVCKLCTEQFDNHEGLLLHIRRVHEGDSIDILARRDHFNRRRTLN